MIDYRLLIVYYFMYIDNVSRETTITDKKGINNMITLTGNVLQVKQATSKKGKELLFVDIYANGTLYKVIGFQEDLKEIYINNETTIEVSPRIKNNSLSFWGVSVH
jgi:hypothetical protein